MLRICVVSLVLVGCGSAGSMLVDGGGGGSGGGGGGTQLANAVEITGFGANPGALKMFLFSPSKAAAKPALVVAMHGCTQTAAAYQSAGWNTFAERGGFYVLYPEQESALHCFSWYDSGNNRRDAGEAGSIAQAVAFVINQHSVDPGQVFATGLSAGGAMTAVMLAAYPDVFKAGAIMSGIPYRCADTFAAAGSCSAGTDLSPQAWGDLVRTGFPGFTGAFPRVSIWNGDADTVVNVLNLTELMKQWTNVQSIDQTVDATAIIGIGTQREFKDASGVTRVETWTLAGMGHGVALAPTAGCGTAAAYLLDVGVCSTGQAAKFFGL